MKFFCYCLALIVTGLSINPCCEPSIAIEQAKVCHSEKVTKDRCCSDNQDENSESEDNNCNFCSPFFTCGTCSGFTNISQTISLQLFKVSLKQVHQDYEEKTLTDYFNKMWQPPKIG